MNKRIIKPNPWSELLKKGANADDLADAMDEQGESQAYYPARENNIFVKEDEQLRNRAARKIWEKNYGGKR